MMTWSRQSRRTDPIKRSQNGFCQGEPGAVTTSPSARWTAQQVVEAFPYESSPRFLLRDRDKIFGSTFVRRVESMGIEEVVTAPGSPWQNPFCERLIGSIRRDCLDHVIVLNERHLLRVLRSYASYYHASRTHRSLDDDCPEPRPIEPADMGPFRLLR